MSALIGGASINVPLLLKVVADIRHRRSQARQMAEQSRVGLMVRTELNKHQPDSLKCQTEKAASDSKETLDIAKDIKEQLKDFGAVKQAVENMAQRVESLDQRLTVVEKMDNRLTAVEQFVADFRKPPRPEGDKTGD